MTVWLVTDSAVVEVSVEMRGDLRDASDFELLRTVRFDEDAFGVFYRRYERLIAGWLVRRTGRPDLAAELTAEVFAAAYLAADRFRDGPEPAAVWLLGIARNKLLKSLRRERAEASSRRRLGIERIAVADEHLAALGDLRNIGALGLLEELPPDLREAVRGRIIDELEYTELASSAQISLVLARQRVSRGLSALRRRLEQEGPSDDSAP
jgi:RNA polymerase sigma factor (sigma-70 family)